jgi:hypothetical protein
MKANINMELFANVTDFAGGYFLGFMIGFILGLIAATYTAVEQERKRRGR